MSSRKCERCGLFTEGTSTLWGWYCGSFPCQTFHPLEASVKVSSSTKREWCETINQGVELIEKQAYLELQEEVKRLKLEIERLGNTIRENDHYTMNIKQELDELKSANALVKKA